MRTLAPALFLASALSAQTRIDVDVTSSSLTAAGCNTTKNAALPAGRVVAPVTAQAQSENASASSSISPETATSPVVVTHEATSWLTSCGWPVQGWGIARLGVDVTVSSTAPGPHWLRVLWEQVGNTSSPSGGSSHTWTIASKAPGGFQWAERRASFLGHPLYLDIPVDLASPAAFTVNLSADAQSYLKCIISCVRYAGTTRGTMTFLVRRTAPAAFENVGAPCPIRGGGLPVAVGYDRLDPAGGRIDALLHCVDLVRRPVILSLGLSKDRIGAAPLPFDLLPLGAPGCALLQDMVVLLPATTSSESLASVPLAASADLRGLPPFYFQWFVPDPANALGVVTSNAVGVRVP